MNTVKLDGNSHVTFRGDWRYILSCVISLPGDARDLNPNGLPPNQLNDNALHLDGQGRAVPAQRFSFIGGQFESLNSSDGIDLPFTVRRIAAVWPKLPPHIRDAILTLADVKVFEKQHAELKQCEGDSGDIARRLARDCRIIIQSCLRE